MTMSDSAPGINKVPEKAPAKVRITEDRMKAYVMLPRLLPGATPAQYTVADIIAALKDKSVIFGVKQDEISNLIIDPIFGREYLVAEGVETKEGVSGEYEFLFSNVFNRKPKELPDGSVDYMSIKSIETIAEGDTIAIYHPAIPGTDGTSVLGRKIQAKRVRDLPPLAGKGFSRSEDGRIYTADISGKIEKQGDRITISPVYEVKGTVGIEVGDIDFAGDVIIHGGVINGVTIQAKGNITVEGLVENCIMSAFGDIFLLKGVKGGEKSEIRAGGNITAEYIEYATVYAGGDIHADVFFKSNVNCNGFIKLNGKRSSVIGGAMSAVEGITCFNVGNQIGIKTEMYVGVSADRLQALEVQKKKVEVLEKHLKSIAEGLKKFDEIIAKSNNEKAKLDPRRIQLLRAKIQEEATCTDEKVRLTDMENMLRRGSHATIKIKRKIFPGVIIGIGQQQLTTTELQERVRYIEGMEGIITDVLSQEGLND